MLYRGTLAFFLCLLASSVNAQVSIKGIVVSRDSIPLPFASVSLSNSTKEIAQKYCDSTGYFRFDTNEPLNDLLLVATYLNKKSDTVLLRLVDASHIYLMVHTDPGQSETVIVTARGPLIKRTEDRIIYSIEANPIFENKNVVEILKSIPRVTVNGFNIGITGQGTVAVMINNHIIYMTGKDLLDYLNVFRSDITSVEVIPNPPAKYDAEGGGGLINIVTKRGKAEGLYGDAQTVLTKNSYWQSDSYLNLRLRDKNLNVSAGLGYGPGDYKETVLQTYYFNADQSGWQSNADNRNRYKNFNASLAADYQFNKSLSVNLTLNAGRFKSHNFLRGILYYQRQHQSDSLGIVSGNEITDNKHVSGSLNIHKDLKAKKGTLDISFDIFRKQSNTDHHSTTTNYDGEGKIPTNNSASLFSYGQAPRNISSAKVDLSLPSFFYKWNTDVGIKYAYFDNHSKIGYDQLNNGQSIFSGVETTDQFTYREHDIAAYVQLSRAIKKWTFKGGLRYEGTFTAGHSEGKNEDFSRTFHNLFPSLFVQYNINTANSVGFTYSRRINRPRLWDVNPYHWYSGIYSFAVGNPALIPAIQNNFDVSFTFWNQLFITVYYNRQRDPIISLPFNNGIVIESRKVNLGTIENYGATFDYNITLFKKLQNSFSVSIGSYRYKSSFNYTLPATPVIATFQSNHSIDITSTFSASLGFSGTLPGGGINIMRQSGNYNVDIALKKLLFKNKFEIGLSAQDIFKSSSSDYTVITPAFSSSAYNYYDFRYVAISFKYKFGKQLRAARNRSGILGTERMRL